MAKPDSPAFSSVDSKVASIPQKDTLSDKTIEKTFVDLSKAGYKAKVWPVTNCMRRLGNMYSASLYGALASLVHNVADLSDVKGKKIGMFSFGSGLASSFFAIRVDGDLSVMKQKVDLEARLASMVICPPEDYVKALHVCSLLPSSISTVS